MFTLRERRWKAPATFFKCRRRAFRCLKENSKTLINIMQQNLWWIFQKVLKAFSGSLCSAQLRAGAVECWRPELSLVQSCPDMQAAASMRLLPFTKFSVTCTLLERTVGTQLKPSENKAPEKETETAFGTFCGGVSGFEIWPYFLIQFPCSPALRGSSWWFKCMGPWHPYERPALDLGAFALEDTWGVNWWMGSLLLFLCVHSAFQTNEGMCSDFHVGDN